jgi:heme/copper-type cytochrome/quinol oxidase subunit 2
MTSLLFWIIILIFAAICGIYIFLVIGSIKNKSHNQTEAKKVVSIILVTSILGFMIFSWNTFTLLNSIENLSQNLTLPTVNKPTIQNNNTNPQTPSNTKDGYYNF